MRDIDIFGHVHNSVYLDYCEDAVSDYLRKIDIYSHFRHKDSAVGYLVKKAEVTFFNSLEVEDLIGANVAVTKVGNTSLTFEIKLARMRDHAHCATGQLIWVCVDRESGEPIRLPDETRAAIAEA